MFSAFKEDWLSLFASKQVFCIQITSEEWFPTALNSLEDKELVKAKAESGTTMPILELNAKAFDQVLSTLLVRIPL